MNKMKSGGETYKYLQASSLPGVLSPWGGPRSTARGAPSDSYISLHTARVSLPGGPEGGGDDERRGFPLASGTLLGSFHGTPLDPPRRLLSVGLIHRGRRGGKGAKMLAAFLRLH